MSEDGRVPNCDTQTVEGDVVIITHESLSVESFTSAVTLPQCGAISTFIGTTRDNFDGKKVKTLEYDCYTSMAVKELKSMCTEMRDRWNDIGRIAIGHRLGLVQVCEASVIIAVSSPHRANAIAAMDYSINRLKEKVPIWKKEIYEDDASEWKSNKECAWT